MRRLASQMVMALPVWLLLGGNVAAMCIWFAPPSRQFLPATNMRTLVVQEEDRTRLVVQPEFSGDATDFALVMPFPAQPELAEAPEELFDQLEELTNPISEIPIAATLDLSGEFAEESRQGIDVLDVRNVGDYTATTLVADTVDDLTNWLNENNYEITDEKQSIIGQYVDDGAYFVALKVNFEAANVGADGLLQGELNPLEFSYSSTTPTLPLRLMSGDGSLVTLTVYTVSDSMMYIPGAELQFSRKVTSTDIKETPSLEDYNTWKKWLVRNVVQLDTSNITADLALQTTSDSHVITPGEGSVVLNPELLDGATGVLVSESGDVRYTDNSDARLNLTRSSDDSDRSSILWVVVFALVLSNVVMMYLIMSKNQKTTQ